SARRPPGQALCCAALPYRAPRHTEKAAFSTSLGLTFDGNVRRTPFAASGLQRGPWRLSLGGRKDASRSISCAAGCHAAASLFSFLLPAHAVCALTAL